MDDRFKALAGGSVILGALFVFGQMKSHFVTVDRFEGVLSQVERNERISAETEGKIKNLESRIALRIEKSSEKIVRQVGEKIDLIDAFSQKQMERGISSVTSASDRILDKVEQLELRVRDLENKNRTKQ